jgi:outer membrane protein TolC
MKRIILTTLALMLYTLAMHGQNSVMLTLTDVVKMAQELSPDAVSARNSYESEYLSYRNYKAGYLPSLSLSTSPNLNRSTRSVTLGDGTEKYVRSNSLSTNMTMSLNQNVWFTGGSLSLYGSVSRLDQYGDNHITSYYSQPLQLGFSQDLSGFNSFKWQRKTEPAEFRRAKKQYVETMELVAANAVEYYFSMASAQTQLDIARINMAAADTLYTIGLGRYNIGTITENELLQLELSRLNEENNIINAQMGFDDAVDKLRKFLNLPSETHIEVSMTDSVPQFEVSVSKALELANENNPDVESMQLSRLYSERELASAKSQVGLKSSVYVRLGLAQTSENLSESMRNFNDEQSVSISMEIPILDWGKGRGRVRIAQNSLELTKLHVQQQQVAFERNISRTVNRFNMQGRSVEIAYRTMVTAQHRYEVARQLYLTGNSTMLDLNSAITTKDNAYRGYVSALSVYWGLYYTIRSITGYDFEKNEQIEYLIEYGH